MANCEDIPFKAGDSWIETCQDIIVVESTEIVDGVEVQVLTDTPVAIPIDTVIESSVRDAAGVLHDLVVTIAVDRLSFTLVDEDTSDWAKGIAKRDIKFTTGILAERTSTDTFLVKEFITP